MRFPSYDEYKKTESQWLDSYPSTWTETKLKHVAPFQVGWTPPTKNDSNFVGDNLWANISDLKQKTIYKTGKQISDEAAKTASMEISPKGSLLYSFKLSVGAVAFAGVDMYTNEAIATFLPDGELPLRFLYYSLPIFVIKNASTNIYGARILNQDLINNSFLVSPPFAQAQKIAAFLDYETAKIDALIEKQQQLIALLGEKRQAVISHAVTKGLNPDAPMRDSGVEWLGEVPAHWTVCQLKFNTTEMQTGPFGSQLHAEDYVEGGIPLVNPAHMVDGGITPESGCSVDLKTQERLCRHKLSEGDVIFARRGELGRCAVIQADHAGWLCGTGSLRATLSPKLSPKYTFMLISSDGVRTELSLESKGSTMENLNTNTLGRIRLPVPPRDEQDAILRHIEEIAGTFDRIESNAAQQTQLLQERRTALISAAVTGKIDVRDWQAPSDSRAAT